MAASHVNYGSGALRVLQESHTRPRAGFKLVEPEHGLHHSSGGPVNFNSGQMKAKTINWNKALR